MEPSFKSHTDISIDGWLSSIPKWLQPYALIARLDRPIGWWLLALPGWWAILMHHQDATKTMKLMGLFLLGAIIMRGAGCVINDLWDRDIDKKVARTALRPLAAGTLSVQSAFFFLGIILSLGLVILLQLPLRAWIMGIFSFPLIICYPLAKRISSWPQVVLGFVFSWGVLLGAVSMTDSWPSYAVIWVYAGTVCWIIGYDTIYAVQDKEDDILLGVGSAALSMGTHLTKGVMALYCFCIIFWTFGFWLQFGFDYWLVGLAGSAIHLSWQCINLTKINKQTALILFKSNRDCGLILAAGLLLQIIL